MFKNRYTKNNTISWSTLMGGKTFNYEDSLLWEWLLRSDNDGHRKWQKAAIHWIWNRAFSLWTILVRSPVPWRVLQSAASEERQSLFDPQCRCSLFTSIERAPNCQPHSGNGWRLQRTNFVNYTEGHGDGREHEQIW